MKKIAITGGLASGKSTVCQFFQELGAYIVSSDAIVHELLEHSKDLGQKILRTLGSDVLRNGKIDRKLLADKVFRNPDQLRQLEKILHPGVLQEIERRYEQVRLEKRYRSFVVEMPLLYEINAEGFYDAVVTVVASESVAKKRFEAKGHTEQEYEERMSRQIDPSIKAKKASYTIVNNGSLADLHREVEKINTLIGVSHS